MIGLMRKRITFANPTVAKSSTGGSTLSYATLATVWCQAERSRVTPQVDTRSTLQVDYKFTTRYSEALNSSLSKDTRITYEGNYYNVTSIEKIDEHDFFIVIKATSINSGGI